MSLPSSSRRLRILRNHLDPSLTEHEETAFIEMEPVWGSAHVSREEAKTSRRPSPPPARRAVIIDGVRTPFVKSFGKLESVDSIGLGVAAVRGLIEKTGVSADGIDEVIWGNVVVTPSAPNVAREIVLDLHLPPKITGVTVSRACLSGLQAIMQGVQMIEHGDADIIIAGGSDSMSSAAMVMPTKFTQSLAKFNQTKNKDFAAVKRFLAQAGSPTSWFPQPPAIAERATGKSMGYHADLMAKLNSVPRSEQDQFAVSSHKKAAAAQKEGIFANEIVPVPLSGSNTVVGLDDLIRGTVSNDKVSSLKPVFRSADAGGTVTAASSSPLTDGASAVLIMSEEKARELGYSTDISFRSFSFTGIDPFPQLLLAPALAIPDALDRAGLSLEDIDYFEIHEAFAAQVLSTIAVLDSDEFAKETLGRPRRVGRIPLDRVNVHGSSIAVGHPFSATGGRLVTTAMNQLRRSGKRFALLSVCAAGGLGGVAILERNEE